MLQNSELKSILRLLKYATAYKTTIVVLLLVTVIFSSMEVAPIYLLKVFLGHVMQIDPQTTSTREIPEQLDGKVRQMIAASQSDASSPHFPWQIVPGDPLQRKRFILLQYILPLGVLLTITTLLVQFFRLYLRDRLRIKISIALQNEVFSKMMRQSLSFFDRVKSGDLISRLTNDIQATNLGLRALVGDILKEIFTFLIGLGAMLYVARQGGWQFLVFSAILMLLTAFTVRHFNQKVLATSKNSLESMAEVTSVMQEMFAGARIIKTYHAEERAYTALSQSNRSFYKNAMQLARARALNISGVNFVKSGTMIGIFCVGGILAMKKIVRFEDLATYLAIVTIALEKPIKRLPKHFNTLMESISGSKRLFEFIDIQPDVRECANPIPLPRSPHTVAFDNVSFTYDVEPVLRRISFTAKAGSTVALVGHSGAGKTTILDLIPRLYDVQEGRITIDGGNIQSYSLASLISNIAVVPQESFLFHTTIRENIRFGRPDATDEDITNAAKASNCHEFIMALDNGYDTVVGDRGVRLSGGQRQRLAIARAIIKDAPILLLDEATSELDSTSEQMVQDALSKLRRGRTTLVIAHRLSTVRDADNILVLDRGKIVEQGVHDALIAKRSFYYKLAQAQFGEMQHAQAMEVAV